MSNVVEKTKIIDLGTLGTFTLPLASSTVNETDTIVRVQDGNIVAIGGLMRQQSTQRPQPGARASATCPAIGNLFRQRDTGNAKSELVILLKPTIIQGDRNWQEDLDADARAHPRPTTRSRPSAPQHAVMTLSAMYRRPFRPARTALRHHAGHRASPIACNAHQEALNTLLVAARQRRGLHQDHRRGRHRQDAAVPALPRHAGRRLRHRPTCPIR